MRRPTFVAAACLLASSVLADNIEAARDAVRRHDYPRAIATLRPAAEAGNAEAAFMLSQLLRYGRGAPRDLPEACRLLELAAGADFPRAAATLASMLEAKECAGSPRTPAEWRALASEAGYRPAAADSTKAAPPAAPAAELLLRAARGGDTAFRQATA